jgi:hypothetical protein
MIDPIASGSMFYKTPVKVANSDECNKDTRPHPASQKTSIKGNCSITLCPMSTDV